jgi:translation initiation factor IF-3
VHSLVLGLDSLKEARFQQMGFRRRRFDRRGPREPQQRVNHRIRVPEVRVIDANGDMLGVMNTRDAQNRAREQGLDLVEINPKASPPVCKILDYGKFKYEEKKKKRETKRKQSVVEVKEIKLRPKTDDHDLDFKARAARKFLESGNKVKFTVRFRGREITHPHVAREQLIWIEQQCTDIANVEMRPAMEGRTMTMIVSPKATVLQALANAKANAEKERKEAEEARKGKRSGPGSGGSNSGTGDSDSGDDYDDDDYDDDYDDDDDDDDDDDVAEESDAVAAKGKSKPKGKPKAKAKAKAGKKAKAKEAVAES